MYKSVLVISLASVLASCATKNQYFMHKEYGQGNNENPHYVKDRDGCKKSVYANGVNSEGKIITAAEEIESLEKEYDEWLIKSFMEAYKKGSGSYAHAGASAAVAVTSGNTSGNTSGISNQPVKSELAALPEKYKDLDRLRSEVRPCLTGKGWAKN